MIVVDSSQFDKERFYLLTHKIKQNKESYLEMTASTSFLGDTVDHGSEKLKGRRYQDDERIARMVVGQIYGQCKFDIEEAKKKFLAMNSAEIEPIIKYCVNDAAHSDYWYTYEKQW